MKWNLASQGGACAVERAANPLYRTRIDAKPPGYLAHAFCTPWRLQGGYDFRF
jgi:hypothetical protein